MKPKPEPKPEPLIIGPGTKQMTVKGLTGFTWLGTYALDNNYGWNIFRRGNYYYAMPAGEVVYNYETHQMNPTNKGECYRLTPAAFRSLAPYQYH